MKKMVLPYLAGIGFIFASTGLYAQNHLVASNAYIDDFGTTMESHVTIKNTGTDTLRVIVARTINSMNSAHATFFCWAVCYGPATSISPDPITIPPGDSSIAFKGTVSSGVHPTNGVDDITYCFYDMNSISDTVCTNFVYTFAVGINEISTRATIANAYPNPADAATSIAYNLYGAKDARIVLYNMLGSVIKEIKLNDRQNSVNFSTADLKSGVYFYSLIADGKSLAAKKLIVSHH
jgi:hypothetical protein